MVIHCTVIGIKWDPSKGQHVLASSNTIKNTFYYQDSVNKIILRITIWNNLFLHVLPISQNNITVSQNIYLLFWKEGCQGLKMFQGTQRFLSRKSLKSLCFFLFCLHTSLNFSEVYLMFKGSMLFSMLYKQFINPKNWESWQNN
jgi:hypothetical protein